MSSESIRPRASRASSVLSEGRRLPARQSLAPGANSGGVSGESRRGSGGGEGWEICDCGATQPVAQAGHTSKRSGAAGIDGQTIEEITARPEVKAHWLEHLQQELRARTYRPAPVRREYLPKPDGGQRPLGIPTVRDRVVQMALNLMLMPIFEADYHPLSFGFRPRRNAHQAMDAIRSALISGRTEVVDADLSKYFDTIPHDRLLRAVARRVSDGSVLRLIKLWLKAPIGERRGRGGWAIRPNLCGTPQGGVI